MKTHWNLCLLFALLFTQVQAQNELHCSVLANAGNAHEANGLRLEWTLGETVVETFSDAGLTLHQGFHQACKIIVSTHETAQLDFDIQAFPNPVEKLLVIEIEKPQRLLFRLLSVDGRVVNTQITEGVSGQLDVGDLSSGLYFLQALDAQGTQLKTFKIIKK